MMTVWKSNDVAMFGYLCVNILMIILVWKSK